MKIRAWIVRWWPGIVAALVVLFVAYWFGGIDIVRDYLTEQSQPELSFSYGSCYSADIDAKEVVSQEWHGTTLVVEGNAFPDCTAKWLFGSYRVSGNRLLLKYYAPHGYVASCFCARTVRYEIRFSKVADYDVSISSGDRRPPGFQ